MFSQTLISLKTLRADEPTDGCSCHLQIVGKDMLSNRDVGNIVEINVNRLIDIYKLFSYSDKPQHCW